MTSRLRKYPRTQHLQGSRLQPGDEDLQSVPIASLADQLLVVEEKLDGANAGISFSANGELQLQSRGHFLTGGYRERHFNLLKTWANTHSNSLWSLLGARHIMYGEWLYAKHTVYYDCLPHYFMEFDIYDCHAGEFLSTDRRHRLLSGSPVVSVPVVHRGTVSDRAQLERFIGPSNYKTPRWRDSLAEVARGAGVSDERALQETDQAEQMEGLYLKCERDGRVVGRYKFVRASFLTSVLESGSHWLARPILANQLANEVDLFQQVATTASLPPE